MEIQSFDEEALKNILKSALVEALDEHCDLMYEIIEEALEDILLARAIESGLTSESASRDEVMTIIDAQR